MNFKKLYNKILLRIYIYFQILKKYINNIYISYIQNAKPTT